MTWWHVAAFLILPWLPVLAAGIVVFVEEMGW